MSTANRILCAQLKAVRASALALAEQNQALLEALALMEAAVEQTQKPKGPTCPNCGSPKYTDISGMGEGMYQCLDCGTNYEPSAA